MPYEEKQKASGLGNMILLYNEPKQVKPKAREKPKSHYTHITGLQKLPKTRDKEKTAEDILNDVFPPREWVENSKPWIQTISTEPVLYWADLRALGKKFDDCLEEKKATEGICPIRIELLEQLFDELARQMILTNTPRGLLLLRIRNEIKMTISKYHSLYLSSAAYSIRKAMTNAQADFQLEEHICRLTTTKETLEHNIHELNNEIEHETKEHVLNMESDKKAHEEVVANLRYRYNKAWTQLKKKLKSRPPAKKSQQRRRNSP